MQTIGQLMAEYRWRHLMLLRRDGKWEPRVVVREGSLFRMAGKYVAPGTVAREPEERDGVIVEVRA